MTRHNSRIAWIDRQLAAIEQEMEVISEHCTASDDALQKAVQRYRKDCLQALL